MTKTIEVTADSAAPPDAIYALLVEASSWPSWSPIERASVDRAGAPSHLGEIRRFETGRIVSVEEVIEVIPDRRLSYTLLSGLPLEDYRADVDIEPLGSGSRITWRSRFRPGRAGSGWLYRIILARFLRRMVAGLARHAELRAAA